MTRFEKRILIGLGLLILLLSVLEAMVPQPTDWSPSYSRYHRKPFGDELVYHRLSDLFPEVRTISDPLYSVQRQREIEDVWNEPVNHVFINMAFSPDVYSTEHLLDLASWGDHVLIAADAIEGPLADSLHLSMDMRSWNGPDAISDIRAIGEPRITEGVFHYSRDFTGAYFTSYDSSRTRVLAVDGGANPVLLQMAWGEGRIVLCSAPMALTNYHLLKDRNAEFMSAAFSLLPPRVVWWDEAYKVGRMEAQTPIRFLLSQTALRWAWFLSLTLILLFILVYARRQQRAIPIVLPPRNATRDLMHTVGRLYWHKGDHTDLAQKMIAHFKEDLRVRAYLRTFAYDQPTMHHLAAKTGLSVEETEQRLHAIQARETNPRITESDLLKLSADLYEFRQLIR